MNLLTHDPHELVEGLLAVRPGVRQLFPSSPPPIVPPQLQLRVIEDLPGRLTVSRVVALELSPPLLFFLFLWGYARP